MAESEAVGSPVTHELDPRRGRSTTGFGLPAEALDILAVEDRGTETGGGVAIGDRTAGGGSVARVRHQLIPPWRSAPMDMAANVVSGVRGHPPAREFS
ncbi:MAG: hypothetical protein F4Y24_14220 [Gemmatimonadetes bacterium]|nr:hypothetical protein [Gemmatimonadota bacterium]MYG24198.1 hypothetical protein [Gemmatimonadota bacterium]MYJ38371.1 hypothetical protein [Gemmatimonadota bacterium]